MHQDKPIAIVWIRNDLRVLDNPALDAAIETGLPVLLLYIDEINHDRSRGGASKWWLHHSLTRFNEALEKTAGALCIHRGHAHTIFDKLLGQYQVSHVFWNRRYTPTGIRCDTELKTHLRDQGITVTSCPGNVLIEPHQVLNGQGKPFQIFTPYWRHISQRLTDLGCQTPAQPNYIKPNETLAIADLNLLPTIPWDAGFHVWKPGEDNAHKILGAFIDDQLNGYKNNRNRNRPDYTGTSCLSPYLAFGEISVKRIYHEIIFQKEQGQILAHDADCFLSELGWRDFSTYQLYHFQDLSTKPVKAQFQHFAWNADENALCQWQKGLTGYPIVDAGMRQLWQTGWMHNRVRMIVASFLVKDLLLPWQQGEDWFWDTLVDADQASNAANWQWVSGCGADAAPYFRIFNPILQGEKFDPNGDYVRQFVPELTKMPTKFIHKPWLAPNHILTASGIQLRHIYPKPIVDHEKARAIALERYKELRDL